MDLRLFFGVLRRHTKLVIGGIVLGVVLAVFAYGTPKLGGGSVKIVPHGQEVWQSQSTLLITYSGFPYGRTQSPEHSTALANLATLSTVYANLGNGDQVLPAVLKGAPAGATVKSAPVYDANSGLPQPLITLTATAPTAASASSLSARAAAQLQSYVTAQQTESGIPVPDRIELQPLQKAGNVSLVQGHKITSSALIFIAVLTAVVTLAFGLDNHRRGPHAARPVNEPLPIAQARVADDAPSLADRLIRHNRSPVAASRGDEIGATSNGGARLGGARLGATPDTQISGTAASPADDVGSAGQNTSNMLRAFKRRKSEAQEVA